MSPLESSEKAHQTRLNQIRRALEKHVLDIDFNIDIVGVSNRLATFTEICTVFNDVEEMVHSVSNLKDWYKLYLASPEVYLDISIDNIVEDRHMPISDDPIFKDDYDSIFRAPVVVGDAEELPIGYFKEGVNKLCEHLEKGRKDRPRIRFVRGSLNSETLFYSLVPYEFQLRKSERATLINYAVVIKEYTKILRSVTKFMRNALNTQYELNSETHIEVSNCAYWHFDEIVDPRYFYPELLEDKMFTASLYIIEVKTHDLKRLFNKALSTLRTSPDIAFNKLLSRILPYTAGVSADRFAITDYTSTIYIELDHTKSKPSPDPNAYEIAIRYRVVHHKDTSLTLRLFLCWFLFRESHKSEKTYCEQIDNRKALGKNLDEWYHETEIYASRIKLEEKKKRPEELPNEDLTKSSMYRRYLKEPNNGSHEVSKDSFKPKIIQFDKQVSPAVVLEITNEEFQETFQMESSFSSVIVKIFDGENTLGQSPAGASAEEGVLKAVDYFENELKAFELIEKYNQKQIRENKSSQKMLNVPKCLKAGYLEHYFENTFNVWVGGFFIAMEKLEGTAPSSLEHFEQVIDQLNILHEEVGIEHGDVSSSNVIVVDGVPHLINFASSKKYPWYHEEEGDISRSKNMLIEFKRQSG